MKKKLHWLFLLPVVLLAASCAKSYDANGYVYSIITKQPIDSAYVKIYLGDTLQIYDIQYTDSTGYFSVHIGDLACGGGSCPDFMFELGYAGHKPQRFTKMDGDRIYLQAL